MQLTIIKPDNLTIIDAESLTFDLSGFEMPESFWALQWRHNQGEVEYDLRINPHHNPDLITELPDWTAPIIEEYDRLKALKDNPPEPTEEEKYAALVSQRNSYLTATDWLIQRNNDQLLIGAQADLEYNHFHELQHWRQSLRDLPEQYPTSDEWVWPYVPGFLVPDYLSIYAGNEG